jgi:putative ABC transport system permease protein
MTLGAQPEMKNSFPWQTALRIAWRDARASPGKFFFIAIAVAVGVGAVAGVRGFSGAFRTMLLRDARTLMAADLAVREYHLATEEESEIIESLKARGVEETWVTETVSAMSSQVSGRPFMVAVKAVDPNAYPFYGDIVLDPPGSVADALNENTVAGSQDLLFRLGAEVGDQVRLGDESFRVAAVVRVEPDRMTGSFNVGPRVMISRRALDRSGLIQPGSRASQRYLFRLPPDGISIEQARDELRAVFEGAYITDYRETHPTIRRGLDRATNFLSLVSLVALIVGSLGVAMAMYSHLQQKLDTIAIFKCLGARSSQIIRIFTVQTVGLALAGSLLGIFFGWLIQVGFPAFLPDYLPVPAGLEWQPVVAVQALAIGLLTTLLFTLPTLLGIRDVRPALVFRRGMETQSERRGNRTGLKVGVVIVAGLVGVAAWLSESLEVGAWFAGGLAVSLLLLNLMARFLLRFLKALPGLLPRKLPPSWRHGVANLHRPGVHADVVLVALGVGVMFTLTVYILQASVVNQLALSAPPEMPNLFLANITNPDREALEKLINEHEGVEGEVDMVPSVAARLVTIDGVPLEQIYERTRGRTYRATRNLTWERERPEYLEVIEGAWWEDDTDEFLVSARESTAKTLDIKVGSELVWIVGSGPIQAKVAAIHRAEAIRPGSGFSFIMTPSTLRDVPTVFYGSARIAPRLAADLQKAAFEEFPAVTIVSIADVLEIVQEVVDQIGTVIRFVSGLAILAGIVILASSVVATRMRRVRETAILKTLGATRRRVTGIFSVEFLILGLSAGLMGSLLATVFSGLLLEQLLEVDFRFDALPHVISITATAVLANLAGWLASWRILGRKPLEVLRGE